MSANNRAGSGLNGAGALGMQGKAANGAPGEAGDQQLQQELTALKREYERLRDEKVRADRDVETLTQQLEGLRAQAEVEYGTADPEQLLALLEEKRQENARLVAEYRGHLAAIRKDLEAVEQAEQEAGNGSGGAF